MDRQYIVVESDNMMMVPIIMMMMYRFLRNNYLWIIRLNWELQLSLPLRYHTFSLYFF